MKYNPTTGKFEDELQVTSSNAAPPPSTTAFSAELANKTKLAAEALAPKPPSAPAIPAVTPSPAGALQPVPLSLTATQTTTTNTGGSTKKTSENVSGITQTPKEIELQKDLVKLEDQKIVNQEKQNLIEMEKAAVKQQQADQAALRAVEMETKKNDLVAQNQVRLDADIAEAKKQFQDYKDMKINDYWEDKSTGTKIAAALAVGLGALGSALSGRNNDALTIMNNAVENDFNRQRENILKQKDVVAQSFKSIDEGDKWAKMRLADIDLKEAAAKDRLATEMAAKMTKLGVPEQEIQNNATINKLREDSLARQAKVEEGLRSKWDRKTEEDVLKSTSTTTQVTKEAKPLLTGTGASAAGVTSEGKLMNESQARAQSFMDSAARAEKNLSSLKEPEDSKVAWLARQQSLKSVPLVGGAAQYISELVGESESAGPIGNKFTPEEQQYFASQREWIASLLRKESGAAVTPQEFKEASATYFPQPGDSAETKAAKAKMRKDKVKEMKVSTGNLNQKLWFEE